MSIRKDLEMMGNKKDAEFSAKLTPNVDPKLFLGIKVPKLREYAKKISGTKEAEEFLTKLGFASSIQIIDDESIVPKNAVSIAVDDLKVFIPFEELVDIAEEIKRLEGEKTRLESEVLRGEKMLSNPGFVNKAPEAKVNEEKAKLENYKQMLKNVEERLSSLK